jgi:SMC interacting uncharacterized protein involved in chromosome segregation
METKLITRTIKELADEYDGNVEQLHRTIENKDVEIKYLKNENDDLRRDIRLEQFARENAEDNAKISAITMIIFCAASAGLTVYNYLFV